MYYVVQIFRIIVIVPFLSTLQSPTEVENDTIKNEKNCRERNRLITTNKSDIYSLVDALPGQKLILKCHYCEENDNHQPKVWYKTKNLFDTVTVREVQLGMETNSTLNRIHVNTEHSLVFANVSSNDSGLYYCLGLEGQELENRYNYLVDTIFDSQTKPESGNLKAWKLYHDENLAPVNSFFNTSLVPEIAYIRDKLLVKLEVATEWEKWRPCEVCGRPQGEGRRRKKGHCRLKFTPFSNMSNITFNKEEDKLLYNLYELSCRSEIIGRYFPFVSNITKALPHFIQTERCEGTCNPDAEGLSKGWKTGKTLSFKYRKSYVLAQNDHLTLVCPESTLENVVKWWKDGKLLKAGEGVQPAEPNAEPRILVDTFNTLYLHGVTSEESGNYTCQVDKIRMQQVIIRVVSKSRLLTKALIRHVMYLAFVLSLTMTCYCAGLVITWKRKNTFMNYEQLIELKKQSHDYDYEEEEHPV